MFYFQIFTFGFRTQSKPDSADVARIAKLDHEIADSHTKLENLQEKTEHINDAIKALEKKILDIGGSRLLAQKSKVDGLRTFINIANDEVTKAEVAVAKAEKEIAKLQTSIKDSAKNLQDVDDELETLNEELGKCKLYVQQFREKVEAAQEAEENSKADYEKLKAAVDEKAEEVQDFRKKEVRRLRRECVSLLTCILQAELERALKDVENEMAQNDRAIDHYQAEHDKLKLEDVE